MISGRGSQVASNLGRGGGLLFLFFFGGSLGRLKKFLLRENVFAKFVTLQNFEGW